MYDDIAASDDIHDRRVSRSWRADVRQRPGCVNDAIRFVVRPLEDGDQLIDETENTLFGCRLVSNGVNKRPQSISTSLPLSVRCLQLGTNHVEERVDSGLRRSSLVDEHVTQQSKCALVDLTTANRNT